eukprot:CAMPEP_0174833778 /NCGR_PEP_ID=MMETSP1114-20130205/4439_1 /TAXON_ID=312471 /ORGANISM="Neobodo designis, Strain CCAP 1951/1" /LENGTH=151 /DNA_ID=CAMNT_0016067671 /DNA_START=105 /DNA_END=557 /DNA_ORIENTATION=+
MEFWGYVVIAFFLFTIVETLICCYLQRGSIAALFGKRREADPKKTDGEADGDGLEAEEDEMQALGPTTNASKGHASFRQSMLSAAAAVGSYRPDALAMPKDVAEDFMPYSPDAPDRPPRRATSPGGAHASVPEWLRSQQAAFSSDDEDAGT